MKNLQPQATETSGKKLNKCMGRVKPPLFCGGGEMQEIEAILKSAIPCRIEAIWGTFTGVVGTMITFLFGQWNDALTALAMFMFIDYLSGVMAAYMKPRAKLSSKRGLRGIVKKLALIPMEILILKNLK